jgi:hypothetical protein
VFTEDLLQFIWQYSFLEKRDELKSIEDEKIDILHPGQRNHDAGPDFLNAKIKIGKAIWAGNIELHLKSSDWLKHKHSSNKAYDNIILHVVYESDTALTLPCSTLELKQHIRPTLLHRYEQLMQLKKEIACASEIGNIKNITKTQMLERVLIERLEKKTEHIQVHLTQTQNNWNEVFYRLIARSFGLKINQDAFETLASHTPLKLFAKHKKNLLQIEALLFGQAGFLERTSKDAYFVSLKKEYDYLRKLYSLKPNAVHLFKFLRLRPANFPTIRLAQFAQLLYTSEHLFSKITSIENLKDVYPHFESSVSEYWQEHYQFEEKSTRTSQKKMGKSTIDLIIINTIIPLLYIYGKMNGEKPLQERALRWLEQINAEENNITKNMMSMGFPLDNAKDSQALLELKKNYCDTKRCLHCSIGFSILR